MSLRCVTKDLAYAWHRALGYSAEAFDASLPTIGRCPPSHVQALSKARSPSNVPANFCGLKCLIPTGTSGW